MCAVVAWYSLILQQISHKERQARHRAQAGLVGCLKRACGFANTDGEQMAISVMKSEGNMRGA